MRFLFGGAFIGGLLPACGGTSPVEPDQSLEVLGKVRHADFGGRPGDADGMHCEAHDMLDPGERVFEKATDCGATGIGQPGTT